MMAYYSSQSNSENKVYFYHADHLGSASWITNHNGDAVQHIQYLPYGEPYVNERPFGYSERFLFTGKERDEETGYGYFGARYMDHELTTMWLSVDRYADKYPFISPYAYCAWNPIRLTDPTGDTIDSESQQHVAEFREKTKEFMEIHPQHREVYEKALAELSALENSTQMYHIEKSNNFSYNQSGETTYDLRNNRVNIAFRDGYENLAHELVHAFQFEEGKMSFSRSNGKSGVLYDLTDERDAYARERLYHYNLPLMPSDKWITSVNPGVRGDDHAQSRTIDTKDFLHSVDKTFGETMKVPGAFKPTQIFRENGHTYLGRSVIR